MKSLRVGSARDKQPQEWQDFVRQVSEAAQRKPRTSAATPPPGDPAALRPENPLYQKRRCQHVSAKSGKQCKNWSMRGATRCHFHGGYRQAPTHPATVRLFTSGEIDRQSEHIAKRPLIYERGRETERREAQRALLERRLGSHAADVLEGMNAFAADDGGKAWRRWLATLDARQTRKADT